jgi:hypothetical protein
VLECLLSCICLATCSRDRIEIGPCVFGARINDDEWGVQYGSPSGAEFDKEENAFAIAQKSQGSAPAKDWFAHKPWKRYKGVLCLGFFICRWKICFRARKSQQLTENLLLSGRCGSEIIPRINNWTKSRTFRNIAVSGTIRSHFLASNEVCQSDLTTNLGQHTIKQVSSTINVEGPQIKPKTVFVER